MPFDVATFREQFPALAAGTAYFDSPGGTQTPRAVGDAIARTLTRPLSNHGSRTPGERNAEDAIAGFRQAMADLLGASPEGIVHGRSATQLTYDFSRHLAKTWAPGDAIVLSRLDHDANVRPWVQAAAARGVDVRWLELDPASADLDLDGHRHDEGLDAVVDERTRLVAVTAASNLLGTRPDVARIARRAHEVGALVHVDAVHHAAHGRVDLAALGADLLVCSPYKFFGPHCAALAADPALLETLRPDKLLPSSDAVPERFELGTLPYEVLAGATAAVDVIADLAPAGPPRRERIAVARALVEDHELRLRRRVEDGLAGLSDRLTVHSVAADRTSTLFATFADADPFEVYAALADRGIAAPAGTFYAYEPFRALQLDADAGLRVGITAYNDDDDVDRLLAGLEDCLR